MGAHGNLDKWVSPGGLPCRVERTIVGHLCGYVGIPDAHPLFGLSYDTRIEVPQSVLHRETSADNLGVVNLFINALSDQDDGRIEVTMAFDTHKGITFSRARESWAEAGWWFGFDCAHEGDDNETCDLPYVRRRVEELAEQLEAAQEWVHPA